MNDERTRALIADILPGEPDPTLEQGEYYYLQETMRGPRVLRVFALDILPHRDGTPNGGKNTDMSGLAARQ